MEIYAVDIAADRQLAVYGGENDGAEVFNYKEEYTVSSIGDMGESVMYAKFIRDSRLIIVTLDGGISLIEGNEEIANENLGEDVSTATFVDEMLLIGTDGGKVYVYDDELILTNTCSGHRGPIVDIDYKDEKVFSISEHGMLVHNRYGATVYGVRAAGASAFCHISNDVFCLARKGGIQIMKETKVLFEVSMAENVESIILMGKSLALAGDFNDIVLIDTTHHYAMFRLEIGAHITKMLPIDEICIMFSTVCGRVGVVDIRDVSSLRFYDTDVGVIYDFAFAGREVIVGGELGTQIFSLDSGMIHQVVGSTETETE